MPADLIGSVAALRLPNRRAFLIRTGQSGLSAAAVALLAGCESMAQSHHDSASGPEDVAILNTALGLEHEAIAAYQLGAESGLLQKPVLDLAVTFQGQHKAHADLLTQTVRKLGGTPVEPKSAYDFPMATLKSQTDVLGFAADLEQAAVSAYLGAIPQFDDRGLAKAAASILGDEAMHWATLRNALGLPPVPEAFVS
jgi:rubrerythrin